ncbi:siroheme synthase CysG [Advenella sp. RU8]|mgnify:FL=1|uniref:siroheme synthase CysG n=1 Tax=Advenella sp. RU8 TaxID=3399575 RepID=UPI003AABC3F3
MSSYYPIFADLNNRPALVVGGGHVAARKIASLLKAGAQVRVAAQVLCEEVTQWVKEGRISHIADTFQPGQLNDVFLVIGATDNAELNRQIASEANQRQKLVNIVDTQELCSFILPSVIDRAPIQIAISSQGTSPVLIRLLREKLEALIPHHLGEVASLAGKWRDQVKTRLGNITERRRFWESLFASRFNTLVENGQTRLAEEELEQQLNGHTSQPGEVTLVGAGPGDPELLTLKALQAIQQADIVLHDALISDEILELVRRDAIRESVGKRAGAHSVAQEETNQRLVKYAQQGLRVVRLKGGDPFVFGRGAEELEVLKQAQIPFKVIPGITAALGATAYAGIPLTHRDHAQTAMFITGHCRPDGSELEWKTLARGKQTLVIYMGTIKAEEISQNLIDHGRASTTPVAIISHGTRKNQQVHTGTLAQLPELAKLAQAPALIVVGETAGLHSNLKWFGE